MADEIYDAPNQQVVRADESGPGKPPADYEVTAEVDGLTVTLTISKASVIADSFMVRWGDGSDPEYGGAGDEHPSHTYAEPGMFTVYVDPYGDEHSDTTLTVDVTGEPAEPPENGTESE